MLELLVNVIYENLTIFYCWYNAILKVLVLELFVNVIYENLTIFYCWYNAILKVLVLELYVNVIRTSDYILLLAECDT